jgi:hypothetical protein
MTKNGALLEFKGGLLEGQLLTIRDKGAFREKKSMRRALALIAICLALYIFGITIFLLPVIIWYTAKFSKLPAVFRSKLSRCVASLFFVFAFIQLAYIIQLIFLPQDDFRIIATILSLLTAAFIFFSADADSEESRPLFDRRDVAAILMVACFVLPVGFLLRGGTHSIATLGSIQAADAAHHFQFTADLSHAEGLVYQEGLYYTMGFHMGEAFSQNSLYISQVNNSWKLNAWLFVGQYLLFGSILAYVAFYFGRLVLDGLKQKAAEHDDFLLALALGPVISLFYLLPFVYQGFLNYYYVLACALIASAFIWSVLDSSSQKKGDLKSSVLQEAGNRRLFGGYLIVIFGISTSWPLLLPPFLIIPFALLFASRSTPSRAIRSLFSWRNMPLALLLLLQFLPIALQLHYKGTAASQGLYAFGAIRYFHFGVVLLGLAFVIYMMLSEHVPDLISRFVSSTFIPLFIFLAAAVAAQYLLAGELRYYSIKSAYLLEIMMLVLLGAWLTYSFSVSRLSTVHIYVALPTVMVMAVLLLIGLSKNPLGDIREMYRDVSGFGVPAHFNDEVDKVVSDGTTGKIGSFNYITLHFDAQSNKLQSNFQIPFWANTMSYDGSTSSYGGLHCAEEIYTLTMYGTGSVEERAELEDVIRRCGEGSSSRGETFYITTDKNSEPKISELFGAKAHILVN